MDFNQIKQALETTPDLINQVVSSFKDNVAKALEATGMVVRTKEQDQQFLDASIATHLPAKVKEQVDAQFKATMQGIDEKVQAITGLERKPGEKTTDFVARAIEEKKNQGGDPVTKQRVADLEKLLADKETDFKTKIAERDKALFDFKVNSQLDQALASANIAVPVHLQTDEDKQGYIAVQRQAIRQLFRESYQAKVDENGTLLFYEGDKPKLSSKDGKPLGASDLIAERFGSFFAPAGQQGAGSGQGTPGGAAGGGGAFKTTDDIHKHLQGQGLAVGSKAYLDGFEKLATEHKVDF